MKNIDKIKNMTVEDIAVVLGACCCSGIRLLTGKLGIENNIIDNWIKENNQEIVDIFIRWLEREAE